MKNPLFDLYEKLYFHEIEVREHLGSRLQTPMAIIVSIFAVLGFLIQGFDNQQATSAAILFVVLFVASAVSLIGAIYFFIRSWYGNTYAFLPSAEDTEKYRQVLDTTYKQYKEARSQKTISTTISAPTTSIVLRRTHAAMTYAH